MPSQAITSVENNFTKGLVTEFTGLNFPENAAIVSDNVEYTLIGDTLRRLGMDFESNFSTVAIDRTNQAVNTYKWNNVGGDGSTQLVVTQVGSTLYFWSVTAATIASPLSTQKLASTVDLTAFTTSFDATVECQFTDGNGYLFVFHPDMDPIYVTYVSGTLTGAAITLQIRDFAGIVEAGVADNNRPSTLTDPHKYNLQNQGWVSGSPWSTTSVTSNTVITGAKTFTVAAGLTVTPGQTVRCDSFTIIGGRSFQTGFMIGTVTSYAGTTLVLSITNAVIVAPYSAGPWTIWNIYPIIVSQLTTWQSAIGNYPSNADQWWRFKNASGVFDPATTNANTSIGLGAAPKGHYLLSAFNQLRSSVSGITGLTDITTTVRPTNGTWFQGRIWYTGANGSFAASGTASFTTWTENIYFSQIVGDPNDFGKCYQTNDPTSEELFDLLPTDGGVITIQGTGPIFKLFPIQNGMLVFAANGIWFITGSQGIGFAANDYTITKISNIQSISCNSYINVMGLPYFWNEEGIYQVKPAKQGGLEVDPITIGTILTFYESIPLSAKKNVKGDYHPIDYIIQWTYRSTDYSTTTEKYTFDKILNYNVYNKAFFPYTIDTALGSVCGINYVAGPGGSTSPDPVFKYFSSSSTNVSFAELWNTGYGDWMSQGGVDTTGKSTFTTGYKVHGQGQHKVSIPYVYVYSRMINGATDYQVQSVWDYANSGNSGRWSSLQTKNIFSPNYDVVNNRIRLRGHGMSVQFKFKSIVGKPFDFIGWSVYELQNAGV